MELAGGGELLSRVHDAGRFAESETLSYFVQLCAATSFCHARGVCHRDLKLSNCLLDASGVKLLVTDFGAPALGFR